MSANVKDRVAQIRAKLDATKAGSTPDKEPQAFAPIIQLPTASQAQEAATAPATAQTQLDQIAQEVAASNAESIIEELNAQWFIAPEGGRVRVFREMIDPEMGTRALESMSTTDFRALYANRFVSVMDAAGNVRKINVADLWLRHPSRREYPKGLALLPGMATPDGVFNLWRGFAIEPNQGDTKLPLWHLLNVICAGNHSALRYLVGWMAHCVQRPGEPAEVAIVMRGGRGTGKSTVGRWMRDIFGAHGMHLLHTRHLTGNFNAHLRDKCFLFPDEAFFAGDKAGDGVLKGLVTEPTITIEQKGVDAFEVRNRLKLMMASNSDWVVPAGTDERRYLVLDVSDIKKQDHSYFAKLNSHMSGGGLAALLHFLLHIDISKFNIRDVPNTAALAKQKLLSLPPVLAWLYDRLFVGRVLEHSSGWEPELRRDAVVNDFAEYVRRHGLRHVRTSAADVGRALHVVFPTMGDKQASSKDAQGRRPRLWILPDLADARVQFEREVLSGGPAGWPEGDE
ncbi:MAG: hypothetical protein FHK80_00470 [Azoarcus sp. PHD]|nr:MAG: hypothetical protein FHK80_00470 [Azoarcus sp. PHD]